MDIALTLFIAYLIVLGIKGHTKIEMFMDYLKEDAPVFGKMLVAMLGLYVLNLTPMKDFINIVIPVLVLADVVKNSQDVVAVLNMFNTLLRG